MFELFGVIGSILLSLMMILQFRRTYIERKTLKDLSLSGYIACFLGSLLLLFPLLETGQYAIFLMEILCAITDLITIYWIIQAS